MGYMPRASPPPIKYGLADWSTARPQWPSRLVAMTVKWGPSCRALVSRNSCLRCRQITPLLLHALPLVISLFCSYVDESFVTAILSLLIALLAAVLIRPAVGAASLTAAPLCAGLPWILVWILFWDPLSMCEILEESGGFLSMVYSNCCLWNDLSIWDYLGVLRFLSLFVSLCPFCPGVGGYQDLRRGVNV
jgi:hypothetical protein